METPFFLRVFPWTGGVSFHGNTLVSESVSVDGVCFHGNTLISKGVSVDGECFQGASKVVSVEGGVSVETPLFPRVFPWTGGVSEILTYSAESCNMQRRNPDILRRILEFAIYMGSVSPCT